MFVLLHVQEDEKRLSVLEPYILFSTLNVPTSKQKTICRDIMSAVPGVRLYDLDMRGFPVISYVCCTTDAIVTPFKGSNEIGLRSQALSKNYRLGPHLWKRWRSKQFLYPFFFTFR